MKHLKYMFFTGALLSFGAMVCTDEYSMTPNEQIHALRDRINNVRGILSLAQFSDGPGRFNGFIDLCREFRRLRNLSSSKSAGASKSSAGEQDLVFVQMERELVTMAGYFTSQHLQDTCRDALRNLHMPYSADMLRRNSSADFFCEYEACSDEE